MELLGVFPRVLSPNCAGTRSQVRYLESQVAQNNEPPYPKVAHNSPKCSHNYRPLAFQEPVMVLGAFRHMTLKLQTLGVPSEEFWAKGSFFRVMTGDVLGKAEEET